ncbi:MAG TPA: urease accessory protein UreE [Hyphomicrobiales bacterium]|nr:urease accessory protein UreE [Hyphomicrobiales bacterium]
MHSAVHHRPKGLWPDNQAEGNVTLDFDARHRRRCTLKTDEGETFLLDLPKAIAMSDGDGLRLGDGRWIRVRAAPELVVDVHHPDPRQMMRLAWHLGNRHLSTEILPGVLRIRPDHVIEEMLVRLGAQLRKHSAPFQPEGGAYAAHDHGHGPSHDRHHDHDH